MQTPRWRQSWWFKEHKVGQCGWGRWRRREARSVVREVVRDSQVCPWAMAEIWILFLVQWEFMKKSEM